MSKDVKLTIYVPEEVKEELTELAKQYEPRTSTSAFSLFLLRKAIEEYKRLKASPSGPIPFGAKIQ